MMFITQEKEEKNGVKCGNITPVNLLETMTGVCTWIVAVEVVLGYVMLGGLISIFVVKIARRD